MERNGFTLIELLAVIIILGIIALIAMPTVNNIVNQGKKGAFATTANNVVSAIEDACQFQTLSGEAITETYTFIDGVVSPSLNVKGKLPTTGTATVDKNCNVTLGVSNGTYTATIDTLKDSVIVFKGKYDTYANGTAVYFNPETGEKCTSGEAVSTTGIKTGCMKWYTFNDSGDLSSTVNLILDHNTTAAVAWNSTGSKVSGPTNLMTQLASDTSSWVGVPTRTDSYNVSNGTANYTINYSTYKARLITGAEIAIITGHVNFNENTTLNNDWFYFDSNNRIQTSTTIGSSNYDWLFDYTKGCTSYGCNIADASSFGYWTSTAISGVSHSAWRVYGWGSLDNGFVEGAFYVGVRPVITISKLVLQ